MKPDYLLQSTDALTLLIKAKGILTWNALTDFIKHLPYGRNENRSDLSLIVTEHKGTCSSKHALLKHIADLNQIPHIKLVLGMYKMNQTNTPKIGNALSDTDLDYLPEAHCYLIINGERVDFTSSTSDINRLKNDILLEKEIQPHQVVEFKVAYHKDYMKKWIKNNDIPLTFNAIWKIREHCIANLST